VVPCSWKGAGVVVRELPAPLPPLDSWDVDLPDSLNESGAGFLSETTETRLDAPLHKHRDLQRDERAHPSPSRQEASCVLHGRVHRRAQLLRRKVVTVVRESGMRSSGTSPVTLVPALLIAAILATAVPHCRPFPTVMMAPMQWPGRADLKVQKNDV
jgi:hypothetical protein